MALVEAAGAIEKCFSGLRASSKQSLDRIPFRYARRMRGLRGPRVQKSGDFQNLRITKLHRGHALVRAALAYHLPDLVALHFVRHHRRAHKTGPPLSRALPALAQ